MATTSPQPIKIQTLGNFPNSTRVYIQGEKHAVKVPMREISQSPNRSTDGSLEENPPIRVYDTSGP